MAFLKRSVTTGLVVVAISLATAGSSQAESGRACDVTVRAQSGAGNQVIQGDVSGVGNGRGVTVTEQCRPVVAPKNVPPAAKRPVVSRECRHLRPAYVARCEWHLKRLRDARRLVVEGLSPR
ncbi:hypothetical protein GCM10009539_23380 [Cryptosporangium japonicum]|uniref:Secreted protein n=1 Tax=Cryptosporangium japonicum TaxID=80872 RepID=A0ABP3DRK8_9ACTN